VSRLKLWMPPALLAGTIFVLSSMSQVPGATYVWDKLAHLTVFGGLCLLTLRATHGGGQRFLPGPAAAAFGLVVLWGALDEVHQFFVPGRDASVRDVVADALGAGLAILLWAAFRGTARIPRVLGGGRGAP
jgi:VanZ family protein